MRSIFWSISVLYGFLLAGQELPTRPNKLDTDGRRTGEWILFYDSAAQRIELPDSAANYILASFNKDRPIGRSEMFYRSGFRQWIGYLYDFDSLKIHGKATYYYPNGNVQTEINWDRNMRSGPYTEYYENGMLSGTGQYVNGEPDGYWELYFSNGNLLSKGNYKNGLEEGIWEMFNEDGSNRSKGLFQNGKEEGYWEFYFENGVMESKGILKKGEYHGDWIFHHNDGTIKSEEHYVEGLKQGKSTFYHENGKLYAVGSFLDDVQHGIWKYYHETGPQRSEGNATMGQWDGYWIYYYENGQIEKEGLYKNDKEEGKYKFYREDGSIDQVGTLSAGIWEGPATFYHPNGKVKGEGDFKNDQRDGPWVFYDEEGNITQKATYKEGLFHGPYEYYRSDGLLLQKGLNLKDKKEGEWVFYYDNGNLSTRGIYKKDQRHGFFKKYYESGVLKEEGSYDEEKLTGYWKMYDEQGVLTQEGPYENDKRQGHWKFYHTSTGKVRTEGMYTDGVSTGVWVYNYPDGTLKSRGEEIADKKIGHWTFYHENGNLDSKGFYINDKAHGEYHRYDTLGNFLKTDHYWYDDFQNFSTLYDSTFTLIKMGDLKAAQSLYKQALKKFKESFDKETLKYSDIYPFKADYEYALGSNQSEKKKEKIIGRSKDLYRKALEHIKRFKPDTSTWYITVNNGLAYLDYQAENYEEASKTYKEGLDLLKKRPDGLDLELYSTTLRNVAESFQNIGRDEEAVEMLTEELSYRIGIGGNSSNILSAYASLVDFAWNMDSLNLCMAMADSIIQRAKREELTSHWSYPEAYYNKGRVYGEMELADSAFNNYDLAIKGYLSRGDSTSVLFVHSLLQQGHYYRGLYNFQASRPYYVRAIQACQRADYTGWIWRRSVEALGNQYWEEKNYEESANVRKVLIDLERSVDDTDVGSLSNAYQGVALALGEMDASHIAEAEEYYQKALEVIENYGSYHWAYASAANSYTYFLRNKTRDAERAEEVIREFLKYDKRHGSPNVDYETRAYYHLASIKQREFKYDSAIYYAGLAEKLLEANPTVNIQTYEESLTLIGDCYQALGNLKLSLQYNFMALEAIEKYLGKENTLYATVLSFIATDFEWDGNYSTALQYIKQSLDLSEKLFGTNSSKTLAIRADYGRILNKSKDYKTAIAQLIQSTQGLESIGLMESTQYLSAIEDLAQAYEDSDKIDQAREVNTQIERLARRMYGADHETYQRYRRSVARFYLRIREYDEAYELAKPSMDHAVRVFPGSLREAWYTETVAQIHFGRQEYTQAVELRERVADIYKANSGEGDDYMETLFALGEIYRVLGQYQNSIDAYKFCAEWIAKNNGAFSFRLTYPVREISTTYRQAGQNDESLKSLDRLKELYDSLNLGASYYVTLHQLYGLTHLEMGSLEKARENILRGKFLADSLWKEKAFMDAMNHNLAKSYLIEGNLQKAKDIWTNSGIDFASKTMNDLVFYYDDIAALYTALDDLDKAEEYWDQLLDYILARVTSDFTRLSESGKAAFWDTYRENFENYNTFALKSYAAGDRKAIGRMYDNQLLTKGILLSTTTRERSRILNSGDTILVNTYYRYSRLKEDLARYYGFTRNQLEDESIDMDSLEREAERMERVMSLDSDGLDDEEKSRTANWRSIQRSLKPGEAAVEIIRFQYLDRVQTDSVLYAALILTPETRTSPKFVLLNNGNELENKHIKAYKSSVQFKLNDTRSYTQFWEQIDRELGEARKVYLSPDGVFNQLNVGTLKKPNGQFLIDAYSISLVTSTRDLILTKKTRQLQDRTAHIFGFPTYDLAHEHIENLLDERGISRSGSTERALDLTRFGFNELPGTKVETEGITDILNQNNWITNLHLAERALEEDLKMVSNPTILHIATHGFFLDDVDKTEGLELGVRAEVSRENPLLRSGLLMTGAAQTAKGESLSGIENGIFTAYEAMNLNLNQTELVVLSACETGRGEIKNGEGVYGLQRAFQIAGADAILMSLWKVDDAATQLLMTRFYENFIRGKSKVEALRLAQESVRESYDHPYFWGAFVLIGG